MRNKFLLSLLLVSAFTQADESEQCTVASVHDGDTIRILCSTEHHQIRLYCIDAPELSQKPYGQYSKSALQSLLNTNNLTIKVYAKDRYGRLVGEILDGVKNLNLQLVSQGNAAVYPQYCKDKEYFAEESLAKIQGLGIWKVEGLQQQPWIYRSLKRKQ